MRKKKAQKLRKLIFGDLAHKEQGFPRLVDKQLTAGPLRRAYQKTKKNPKGIRLFKVK